VFTKLGHSVCSAADGFAALIEIRQEVPGILLPDLNMRGMSGFELVSVVRRRFPAIRVIAMSGGLFSDEVLSSVAADAFYRKGSGVDELLEVIESAPPWPERISHHYTKNSVPIWIQKNGHDASGDAFVMIACPECLRTFSLSVGSSAGTVHKTDCIHCHSLIHYAIVKQPDELFLQVFRQSSDMTITVRSARSRSDGQCER
jgi:CheY-like chemotaxis protein